MSPILLIFGTFGNVLTIIVLSKRRSRGSSTAVYLCGLAISDIIALNTGLLRQWLNYLIDVDIRAFSEPMCKIHVFLVYLGTQCSSWLLVAVTCERFIGVWLPHWVKHGCTKKTSLLIIGIIVGFLSVLNVHWLYGFSQFTVPDGNETYIYVCRAMTEDYYTFLSDIWPWIDLCVFCAVPFTILLLGNISIILKVFWSRRKTRKQVVPTSSFRGTKTDDRTSQLTVMLLLLNVVFFVNIAPISIFLAGESSWLKTIKSEHEEAVFFLWWAVVNMFMYLNHAVNFVLYFLSGSRFRAGVKSLFCGGQSRSVFGKPNTTRIGSVPSGLTVNTTPDDMSASVEKRKSGRTVINTVSLVISKARNNDS